MSFTSSCLNKIPPIVPRSDIENFYDQTFYEQCLDVLMSVGVGALLFAIAELRWIRPWPGVTIKYPLTHLHLYNYLDGETSVLCCASVPSVLCCVVLCYAVLCYAVLHISHHASRDVCGVGDPWSEASQSSRRASHNPGSLGCPLVEGEPRNEVSRSPEGHLKEG